MFKAAKPLLLHLPLRSPRPPARQPLLPREGRKEGRRHFPSISGRGGSTPQGLGRSLSSRLPEFPPDSRNLEASGENVRTWAVDAQRDEAGTRGWTGQCTPTLVLQVFQMCLHKELFPLCFASKNQKLSAASPAEAAAGQAGFIPSDPCPNSSRLHSGSSKGILVGRWAEGRGTTRAEPLFSLKDRSQLPTGHPEGWSLSGESPPHPGLNGGLASTPVHRGQWGHPGDSWDIPGTGQTARAAPGLGHSLPQLGAWGNLLQSQPSGAPELRAAAEFSTRDSSGRRGQIGSSTRDSAAKPGTRLIHPG